MDLQHSARNLMQSMAIREVPLTAFPGIRVGQVEDPEGGTGITVVLSEDPQGMPAGLSIGGGGPAARETGILDPTAAAQRIHAAVLGGGSAFGLDAAGGVMRYLEEKGIGVEVRGIRVPLVTQIDIFDLPVGDPARRPDQAMAYAACRASESGMDEGQQGCGNYRDGCFGAGCGATVGKYAGIEHAMKSGIGACVLRQDDLLVGAIVAVNAFGDVYDWRTGQKVAGGHESGGRLYTGEEALAFMRKEETESVPKQDEGAFNTTIGIVFTNAVFDKPRLCKIAAMAHDGLARSVFPVHTSGDGDAIIALSVCGGSTRVRRADKEDREQVHAGMDIVGSLAARAVSEAILRGVFSARPAFGLPSAAGTEGTV